MLIALFLSVTLVQAGSSINPTQPAAPIDASDFLLRTVLAEMVGVGYPELKDGPIITERNDPAVSPRVLPDNWKPGFALLTRSEIRAVDKRYYMTLRTKWRSPDQADVTVYVGPTGQGIDGIALCCFTLVKRYERTDGAWRFVRVVAEAIH